MSILRSLALLTLGLFLFSVTVVFSTPAYHSNFAVYAEALGTGISAWARARADEAQDAGWYSVWAQVG